MKKSIRIFDNKLIKRKLSIIILSQTTIIFYQKHVVITIPFTIIFLDKVSKVLERAIRPRSE